MGTEAREGECPNLPLNVLLVTGVCAVHPPDYDDGTFIYALSVRNLHESTLK